MKLLNKLNGWQRIWLLGTVAAQIYAVTTWTAWFYPSIKRGHCYNYDPNSDWSSGYVCVDYYPLQKVIFKDMGDNLGALLACLAAYVAAYLVVIIVRWIISGFKK